MPSTSIGEEANSLLKYTRKCDQRAAITSSRNKQLDSRQQSRSVVGGGMGIDSDDEMEITGSRKNVKVAKSSALAKLKSTRKKRTVTSPILDDEPLEIPDSDSDDTPSRSGDPGPSRALVVDSPSPKKKRTTTKKTSTSRNSRIKSSMYVLSDVDDDETPSTRGNDDEVMGDENVYDGSFINDDEDDASSVISHTTSSPKRRKQGTSGNEKISKAKAKTAVPGKRKKRPLSEESAPAGLLPIFDDEEDQDFVPDSADEAMAAPPRPPMRSTRKGKQKQVDVDGEEDSVVPLGVAYSDGPNDEGEQTETDAPGPSSKRQPAPKHRRIAALKTDEQQTSTTGGSGRDPDEYGYTDDEPVDLTEEDPIDGGIIDVDVYDDAPSQRFREFEADYGQVKPEPGLPNGSGAANGIGGPAGAKGENGGVDEFEDFMFDQGFMDNLGDFDYMDPGPTDDVIHDDFEDMSTDNIAGAGGAQVYTRTATMTAEGGDNDYSSSEEDYATDRFVPISALSEADRDFFLNHWRRSATEAQGLLGSEKQLAESRQQQAQAAANPRGRGRGGRSGGGGGGWRGRGRGWRGKR
ncbi:hypothetical protein QFC19_006162 [Naganishia cerealis]|uniref:Uncharacterized protein n=1 Tax=Naganishia cerealis TaxID=610337 RepID=A0ACC2VIH5_9TREE|nr:hypothetical protein QFC19_006162 [Naganishia cerealis]